MQPDPPVIIGYEVAAVVLLQDARRPQVLKDSGRLLWADLPHALGEEVGRQLVGIHHHLLHMYALQGREHDVSAVTLPYKTLVLQQPAQMLRS